MPTYEYRCPKCANEFEKFERKITDKKTAKCPKCGATARRIMSVGAGFLFKGSGFYITDYKRSGEKKEGGEAKAETKADTKAESKPSDKPAEKSTKKSDDKSAKKSRNAGADS